MKTIYPFLFLLLPFSLIAQDCEITLPEDLFVCGFSQTIQVSPFDGDWSFDCGLTSKLFFIEDNGSGEYLFSFSECGIYELVYTVEESGVCTNSDTLMLYVDDPSSSSQTADFDNDLEYDQVSCHSGGTGFCTNQISIQGFPPPTPIWSFCGNGNCTVSETIVDAVEDLSNPCFAESINLMPITINSSYSSCWDTDQDEFIVVDVNADTVIDNSFLSYLDSLIYNEILTNLEDCNSNGNSCFTVTEDCIDSINYDTTAFHIPVHLGGGWNILIDNDTLALSDSTAFTIESRDYFMIIEPGADYYGPDAIDLKLFELTNGGADTVDIFENLSFQMLWTEHWTYDTIEVISPEVVYLDSLRCEVCGGDFFGSSFNVPEIPAYNCGPININFDFGCACMPLDIYVNSTNIDCNNPCADLEAYSNSSNQDIIFEWITPSGNILFGPYVSVCEPGSYLVIVTDSYGCSESNDVYVSEDFSDIMVNENTGIINCYDGCAYFNVSGGSGNFIADILSSSAGTELTADNTIVICTPGEHDVQIQDLETGCDEFFSFSVIEDITEFIIEIPEPTLLTVDEPCVFLEPSVSGSLSPNLVYNWEGPEGNISSDLSPEVCSIGEYIFTVMDPANGCSESASVNVEEDVEIITEFIEEEVCVGDCFEYNNQIFCEEGTYTINVSSNYIVEIDLTVLDLPTDEVLVELCPGEEYMIGGTVITLEGLHEVLIEAESGCDTIRTIELAYFDELPELESQYFEVCGSQAQLLTTDLSEVQGLTYEWGNGTTESSITVNDAGLYSVTVSNECGSTVQDFEIMDVTSHEFELYIPNVFSPNDDGINDEFLCTGSDVVEQFTMRIYDRWGNQIFETDNVDTGWNGSFNQNKAPISNYVYIVEYEKAFCDLTSSKQTKSGVVTLLR